MQLKLLPCTAIGLLLGVSTAFISNSPTFFPQQLSSSSPSKLHSYSSSSTASRSYGIEGSRRDEKADLNPEVDIQNYIQSPEPIAAKSNLNGKVLVSGWVKIASDQTVFDLLNHEDSAMHFDSIVAFVNDEKFAKKRMLSRSARYTGLLDKLSFIQAVTPDSLPTVEQLDGVKHWVANVENGDLEMVSSIADLCKSADSLENVSVLLSGAIGLDLSKTVDIIKSFDENGEKCKFAVVAVGELKDHQEGSMPYDISDLGTEGGVITEGQIISKDESLRLVTETLQLESGANKALTFTEVTNTNTTENTGARLVIGLRQAGYTRPQEIDHMITKGVMGYEEAIEKYKKDKYDKENPDPEAVAKQESEAIQKAKDNARQRREASLERKKTEVEDNARDWAKRQYFRKSLGGNIDMTEEEYIKSVWDRAMFEGDLKYRMSKGLDTDERSEIEEFEAKQEKKRQLLMKKAEEALEGELGNLLTDGDDEDDDDDEDDEE